MTAERRDAEEAEHLPRSINDLIGLVTLLTIWSVDAPSEIVATLLDALVSVLRLDFAYARLTESIHGHHVEMLRVAASSSAATGPETIREAFGWLADDPRRWPSQIPHPFGTCASCRSDWGHTERSA